LQQDGGGGEGREGLAKGNEEIEGSEEREERKGVETEEGGGIAPWLLGDRRP